MRGRVANIFRAIAVVAGIATILSIFWLLYVAKEDRRRSQSVDNVVITIHSGAAAGNLLSVDMVEKLLRDAKIETTNIPLYSISLPTIEREIMALPLVERVVADNNFGGDLRIDVWQRDAALRFMVDGYDCYITPRGYVMDVARGSALHAHVATGSYKPLFDGRFVGDIEDVVLEGVARIDDKITLLNEESVAPILEAKAEVQLVLDDVKTRYVSRGVFEDEFAFQDRVDKQRASNKAVRDSCYKIMKRHDKSLADIDAKKWALERERYMIYSKRCDIDNLMTFVDVVRADPFWRDEITQIMLESGSLGELRVSLAVRSSRMVIHLGSVAPRATQSDMLRGLSLHDAQRVPFDDKLRLVYMGDVVVALSESERDYRKAVVRGYCVEQLHNLKRLYNEILPRVGWDAYRSVTLEFDGQIVCTERGR